MLTRRGPAFDDPEVLNAHGQIGRILKGNYRLDRVIGEGGMGAVFEASHLRIPKRYAVKLLHAQVQYNKDVAERFHREAQIIAKLSVSEEHIVDIVDFDWTNDGGSGGTPFMVLELLQGESLHARISNARRLSVGETAHILGQIAAALDAAHARAIVHRDLKPENVFLCRNRAVSDFVKVLDFGISKLAGEVGRGTKTGTLMGTPRYMSPEQISGLVSEIDARTDIFALGTILYECLTGQAAFDGAGLSQIALRITHGEPQPIADVAPDVPPAVVAVVARALAKRKEDRYASARELRDAYFAAAAIPIPVAAERTREVPQAFTPTPMPAAHAPSTIGASAAEVSRPVGEGAVTRDERAPRRARRRLMWFVGVAGVAALVTVIFALAKRGGRSSDGNPPSDVASGGAPAPSGPSTQADASSLQAATPLVSPPVQAPTAMPVDAAVLAAPSGATASAPPLPSVLSAADAAVPAGKKTSKPRKPRRNPTLGPLIKELP